MKKATYILLFSLFVFLQNCKPDKECFDHTNPECENYDPCYGLVPTSADFYIYQNLGMTAPQGWEHIDEDTILGVGRGITLQTKYKADKYTWYIGSEILHDELITRTQLPANEQITVKLVVENFSPNTSCFPNDVGKDSLTRMVQTGGPLPDGVFYPKWRGTFEGYYDFAPNEKHTFSLYSDSNRVSGLPYNECFSEFYFQVGSYSSVSFFVRRLFAIPDEQQPALRCIENFAGFMHVDDNNNFELKIIDSVDPNKKGAIMKGIKIN